MKEIREYLNMQQIQEVVKSGTEIIYTGWHVNNGHEYLHEVRYRPIQELTKAHNCRIFDLVKISDDTYRCQVCQKVYSQIAFEDLKKNTPVRFCHCGGISKQMQIHIPEPISGWETKPIFLVCHSCAGKYMYYRFTCETEGCGNYCDITEVYCLECRKKNEL